MGNDLSKYLGSRKTSRAQKDKDSNNYGTSSYSQNRKMNQSTLNLDRKQIRAGAMDIVGPKSMRSVDMRQDSQMQS